MKYIEFQNIKDFNPKEIFTCGQCFRWKPAEDGLYEGVASGRYAKIEYADGCLRIYGGKEKDRAFWHEYFDLSRDYSKIKKNFRQTDDKLREAIKYAPGIRILNQELFETVISFIVSANNNIPRIMKIIETLSEQYGTEIKNGYAFPTPSQLSKASVEEISEKTHAGYRCEYILETAKRFEKENLTVKRLAEAGREEARKLLMNLPGVGPKVADCILLFTGARQDVFPVDVWVKRVMGQLYLGEDVTPKQIDAFATEHFGPMCGIAQQYLFMWARK